MTENNELENERMDTAADTSAENAVNSQAAAQPVQPDDTQASAPAEAAPADTENAQPAAPQNDFVPEQPRQTEQSAEAPVQHTQSSWENNIYPSSNAVGQRYNPYTGQPYTVNEPAAKKTKRVLTAEEKAERKQKRKASFLRRAAGTLALALIFGVVAGAVIAGINHSTLFAPSQNAVQEDSGSGRTIPQRNDPDGDGNALPAGFTASGSGKLQSASSAMAEALKKAELAERDQLTIPQINIIMEPAMVSVNCTGMATVSTFFGTQQYKTASAGSGIIVGENETELLIVTNNHVIAEAEEISVQFVNDDSIPALVKGTDAVNDLAVIVVKLADISEETMNAIAYAELGDSDALVIGEGVVAIGNALGFGQSVTNGIVSALNRAVKDENENTAYLIQTNAAINPGNSGGALVNMHGQVIGINSSKYADEAVEGMGFAIPINTALPILEDLMTRTTRTVVEDNEKAAYLGVSVSDISASAQQAYGMPAGVYIAEVTKGLAAEKAGMLKGDILTKFDGETVSNRNALVKLLTYYEAGETVNVTVQRSERGEWTPVELTVTLSQRPKEEEPAETEAPAKTPDIWDYFFGNGSSGNSRNNDENT